MPADRVIIEFITTANMAGADAIKAGIVGFNPLALITTAALGGLVVAGKSAVEISREHAKAENELGIAIKNRGINAARVQDELYQFIQANRDVISNQADVINSTAALVREGVSYNNIKRDQALILDLAAAKNISVAEATSLVTKAEAGNMRGLKDLLGLTMETAKAHDTLAQKQKVVNDNLDKAARKVAGSAAGIDPLEKASRRLNNDWEDIANKAGPHVVGALETVLGLADLTAQFFDKMGKDNNFWSWVDKGLTDAAAKFRKEHLALQILFPDRTPSSVPTSRTPGQLLHDMNPTQYAAYYKTHIGGGSGPGSTGLTPAEFKVQWKFEQDHMNKTIANQDRTNNLLGQIVRKTPVIQIYAQPGTQVSARQVIRQITAI